MDQTTRLPSCNYPPPTKPFFSALSGNETGPLVEILENPEIIKTGVAIKDDVYNLKKIEEFTPAGFEDLAPLAQSLKIEQTGLQPYCHLFLPTTFQVRSAF